MKKICFLAAAAGLALVSASPPATGDETAAAEGSGYPPCSRTVTDRCIQLYERGVGTRENLASNRDLGPGRGPAQGGPEEAATATASAGDYPPCSATVTDRCRQTYEGRGKRVRAARATGRTGGGYSSAVAVAGERG